jgi:hypothetical protein
LVRSGWVTRSGWFGSYDAIGGTPVIIVLSLATGQMPVRSIRFGYMCDACELEALGYSWVIQEQIHLVDRMLRSCLSLSAILCS